jgi:hypothetical protein
MKIFVYLILTLCLFSCKDQNNQPEPKQKNTKVVTKDSAIGEGNEFEATISSILKAFETKNDSLANSFVSAEHNVIIIYRTGVFNEYKTIDKIEFSSPFPQNFPYPVITINDKLKYESLPKFDCGTMEWDKQGLYCDTIHKDTLLSGTPQNLIKYRGDKIADAEVQKLKELEAKSRKVVLAHSDKSLIFYLTLINNKWYLTALDRITTDCSA